MDSIQKQYEAAKHVAGKWAKEKTFEELNQTIQDLEKRIHQFQHSSLLLLLALFGITLLVIALDDGGPRELVGALICGGVFYYRYSNYKNDKRQLDMMRMALDLKERNENN